MWIFIFFVGVFFGTIITALLAGAGRADCDAEASYWRNQYFALKNAGRKDVI